MAKAAFTTERLKARMAVMRGPVVDATHDFTAMTSAQVLTAYPLASFGSDRYVPQADGSYLLCASDAAPVTDKGIVLDGAFTNQCGNSILAGVVDGAPGTKPTTWASDAASVYAQTILGLPGLKLNATTNQITNYSTSKSGYTIAAGAWWTSAVCYGENVIDIKLINLKNVNNIGSISIGTVAQRYTKESSGGVTPGDLLRLGLYAYNGTAVYIAGPQQVFNMNLMPNTLALSSAGTTAKVADIVQREVDLRGPFAAEIVATTAPGDSGAHQTIWCESFGANDYAHVYRATSTNQITLKVRAAGVDYSVACGAVANSTQFTLRLAMLFNKVVWSLNESTAAELTIKRSASYIIESLGTFYDGTLPVWGSVQSVRIAAGKIPTTTEIEEGWA